MRFFTAFATSVLFLSTWGLSLPGQNSVIAKRWGDGSAFPPCNTGCPPRYAPISDCLSNIDIYQRQQDWTGVTAEVTQLHDFILGCLADEEWGWEWTQNLQGSVNQVISTCSDRCPPEVIQPLVTCQKLFSW